MGTRSFFLLSLLALVACGDDGAQMTPPDAAPDAIDYSIGDPPALAQPCTDTAADIYVLPSDLPAMDDSHRGDVFRCSVSEKLTVPEIKDQLAAYNVGYTNVVEGTVNSGFWTYRIAYRTTRNTVNDARAEGDTVATLLIPAKPIEGGPLVVFGHGSIGVAEECAPSRLDLTAAAEDEDYPSMLYRLASYGYTVIAPDYTGFAYGQTIGYFNAEDEAHAVLDATRAAAKILPSPPAKVVFVGHSQGGHAVLSAHSYAKSYGMTGELVGVATLAPLWRSMSMWAAIASPSAGFTTEAADVNTVLYAMEYAYAAGELREPGTGLDVFQADKQQAAKDVMLNQCYDSAGLQALGATPADFFDTTYVSEVGEKCAMGLAGADCTNELSQTWQARWVEDRPPVDAAGPPILAFFGGMDTVVPKTRAACARKKIEADLAAASGATTQTKYCLNSSASHRDIVRSSSVDYVNEWIAAKAGVGTEPAPCTELPSSLTCELIPRDY